MKIIFTHPQLMLDHIDHTQLADAVRILSEENGSPDRCGGVLAIAIIQPDRNLAQFASQNIGAPGLKFGIFARNAAEKIMRLFDRRTAGNDEVAASVSADDKLGTYGGCVVFKDASWHTPAEVYISYSGAPPEVDEAIAYAIGKL